jgi:hypothetical protein
VTREEAREQLAILAQATVSPTLTDDELDAALTASRLPDNEGRPPSDPDFVEENWDLYYAAAECYLMKHVKQISAGTLTEFTSEGANFKKTPPDFLAVADWYRDRSTTGDTSSPSFITLDDRPPRRLRPRSEVDC